MIAGLHRFVVPSLPKTQCPSQRLVSDTSESGSEAQVEAFRRRLQDSFSSRPSWVRYLCLE